MLTQKAANRKDIRTGKADMQHRHYATVATIIRALPPGIDRAAVAQHFADELRGTNPNFDRSRFIAACMAD